MWEKKKLLVQAISPFPTMFSKGFFPRLVKGVIIWERVKWAFKIRGCTPSKFHLKQQTVWVRDFPFSVAKLTLRERHLYYPAAHGILRHVKCHGSSSNFLNRLDTRTARIFSWNITFLNDAWYVWCQHGHFFLEFPRL